jgi:fructose-1,6-bisphosphatase/inositol monophosphatase family enzyme
MLDAVEALLREAAEAAILPRFRRLAAGDVDEKAPGEWVTAADREAERLLSAGLTALLPGAVVVGEEAAAAAPGLLARLEDAGPVWLVDPLDGTANFVAGRGSFAVMVALLRGGAPVAAWMLDPLTGICATAEAGGGAFLSGARLRASADCPPPAALRGAVLTRFLPPALRAAVARRAPALGAVLPGSGCAGREYPAVVGGAQHFVLYWRTLPWDHAPGVLFAHEAGAAARRLDGRAYRAADGRPGLLVAQNDAVWRRVRATLLADRPSAAGQSTPPPLVRGEPGGGAGEETDCRV